MYVNFGDFGKQSPLELAMIAEYVKKKKEGTLTDREKKMSELALMNLMTPDKPSRLKNIGTTLKTFGKALGQPVKALAKPKTALDPRKQLRMGRDIGRAAEATVVAVNPLDRSLEKFGKSGIKAGGVGKILGRTSEKARKNPIATTAIVYGVAVAASKGLLGKAWTAGKGLITKETVVKGAVGLAANKAAESAGKQAVAAELAASTEGSTETMMAGMLTPQNVYIFLGLGALTTIGYFLFQKRS